MQDARFLFDLLRERGVGRGQLHDADGRVVQDLLAGRAADHDLVDRAVGIERDLQQQAARQLAPARLFRVIQVAHALDLDPPGLHIGRIAIFPGARRDKFAPGALGPGLQFLPDVGAQGRDPEAAGEQRRGRWRLFRRLLGGPCRCFDRRRRAAVVEHRDLRRIIAAGRGRFRGRGLGLGGGRRLWGRSRGRRAEAGVGQRRARLHGVRRLAAPCQAGLGQRLGLFWRRAFLPHQHDLHRVIARRGRVFLDKRHAEDQHAMRQDGQAQGQAEPVQRRDHGFNGCGSGHAGCLCGVVLRCGCLVLSLCHFHMPRKGGPVEERGGKFFAWVLYCPQNYPPDYRKTQTHECLNLRFAGV